MLQTYSMILWSKAKYEDFNITIDKSYRLLTTFKEYGPELSPNYLPAYLKKESKIFNLNYENLEELLKRRVNKKGNVIFSDLGYHIRFFSDLNDDNSAGISLIIGVSNPKFNNSLVVNFPISLNIFDEDISNRLITLFKTCTQIINPFWGCIANSLSLRKLGLESHYENGKPTTIHWINFWNEDIIHNVSEDKIKNAPLFSFERIGDIGYILILKKTPIDINSEEDIRLQIKFNTELGLTNTNNHLR